MTTLVFCDVETSGLDPYEHDVWEIAVIRREADGSETEHLFQHRIPETALGWADPDALRINHYHERMAVPRHAHAADMLTPSGPAPIELRDLRDTLGGLLDGAVMIGSNPGFDASFLRVFLDAAPWHYRVVDVATLAAGYLTARGLQVDLPYSSRDLSRAVGVQPPGNGVAHTALGDARWTRDVYTAVTESGARP